jgi:glycerol uptake facilitator-like aquaporin
LLSKALDGFGDRGLLLRCLIEGAGTALLLATAVVAVILPERLWAVDWVRFRSVSVACGLLIAGLYATANRLGGGLFNPGLSLAAVLRGTLPLKHGVAYAGAQIAGACLGVIGAQAALNLDAVQQPLQGAISFGAIAAEFAATFLFIFVARFSLWERPDRVAVRVRGKHPINSVVTPHPSPLPAGEGAGFGVGRMRFKHRDAVVPGAVIGLTFFLVNTVTPLMSFANPAAPSRAR